KIREKKEIILEVYTLGQFSVRCDNQLISAESGRLGMLWELFMYLVTYRKKKNQTSSIQEALWPENDCTDPGKSLKNLVHRLRKMIDGCLGLENSTSISFSQGCYSWNDSVPYELDAALFETLCREARDSSEKEPLQAASKYKEAFELYRGDYLPNLIYNDWVVPIRHYYRQLFLRSVFEMIEICEKGRHFAEITAVCEKIFFIEPFEEELHLRYLEALLKEGKKAQARSHYQYITALLYREFGAKPSLAMQRLYQTMCSNKDTTELNFTGIRELLKEREIADGAMLCDAESFDLVCRLEKRRAKRGGQAFFIVTMTLTDPEFRLPQAAELSKAMENLKQVSLKSLRQGDLFSQWNESQLVLLLLAANHSCVEIAMKRVKENFDKVSSSSDIIPRSTVHPLYSPETI
ncbi:MAG: bacterial transcriptional activator domain-containing protein, partial [Dethiobacteria bacterium]|nr:bacterial transcriptional activator domain-containing protein [Dethiobacteria bacterium]